MKYFRFSLMALILTLGMNTSLQAADFTINVPINISNMLPDKDGFIVRCVVICGYASPIYNAVSYETVSDVWAFQSSDPIVVGIGETYQRVLETAGYFMGTVTVTVDTLSGRYPNNAGKYACSLRTRLQTGGTQIPVTAMGSSPVATHTKGPILSNPAQVGTRCDNPDFSL